MRCMTNIFTVVEWKESEVSEASLDLGSILRARRASWVRQDTIFVRTFEDREVSFGDCVCSSQHYSLSTFAAYLLALLLRQPINPLLIINPAQHVQAFAARNIAPPSPPCQPGKQHFPRLAFHILPRRQITIKTRIRNRGWYVGIPA